MGKHTQGEWRRNPQGHHLTPPTPYMSETKIKDLLVDVSGLDDITNLLDELIEREGIEPLADGSCGYSEADCGSRLCAACGCLAYKNRRLTKVIGDARAELTADRRAARPWGEATAAAIAAQPNSTGEP